MKITERKEIKCVRIENVIVGRKCDVCGGTIEKVKVPATVYPEYNYFVIHTWHNDWGNDSRDSHEYYDACCPECVMQFVKKYIGGSYDHPVNSEEIEISHVRTLEDGAD